MNLSNKLTVSRIGLTFIFMGLLFIEGIQAKVVAFVVFLVACLTDLLDGWVARRRNEVSDFGRMMDPIADKVLVLGAFLAFVELQLIPAWMVIVIIIRESLVTGMRLFAVRKGLVLGAQSAGKHKTVSQMVTISFILVFLIIRDSAIFSSLRLREGLELTIVVLMSLTVASTLYSGFSFLRRNRGLIRSL